MARALVIAGQETGTPVVLAAVAKRRFDGDEAGQVLILGSEPVENPGAHAGALEREDASVELQHGGAVIDAVADHGADHAKIVGAGGDVREQIADRDAALPVLFEVPRATSSGRARESSPNVSPRLKGTGLPLSCSRRGFGSKVSMLEGPPCINRKMMRFDLRVEVRRFRR